MGEKRPNQRIEEIAASLLNEDKLKSFLEFYDFLKSNKLGIGKSGYRWAVKYKNKRICSIRFDEDLWAINYFNLHASDKWFDKFEKYLTVELKNFILRNINTTGKCCVMGQCNSRENRIILGKKFTDRVCACGPIILHNPNGETLEYAKELVLMAKKAIAEVAEN